VIDIPSLLGARRHARTERPGVRVGALIVAACALAACGSAHDDRQATATAPAAIVAHPGPGAVAVRFTKALFEGRFDRARRYVAPGSRNALLVITAGLRGGSLSQHRLQAGSVRVHGTSATVILTGTLCSSHSTQALARAPGDCITNRDRHSTNPVFRVVLALAPERHWQVSYDLPRASGDRGATPAGRTP
jgi:hypothetical protein